MEDSEDDAEDDERSTHSRRTVLGLVSAAVTGLSVRDVRTQVDAGYLLRQGDRCLGLEPLSGDQPVETFYDWRGAETKYSSAGTVALQRPETSILFLYDGPDGVSLVIVHGKYDGTAPAGVVSFAFDGLPVDGSWAVTDDRYDGPDNVDRWTRNGSTATVDWRWSPGRTDGGAFFGLHGDPALELTVSPAFNERGALWENHDGGRIRSWQALSGSLSDPDRYDLSMDTAVTITRGVCGNAEVSPDGPDPTDDEDRPGRREGHENSNGRGHEEGEGVGHEGNDQPGNGGNGRGEDRSDGERGPPDDPGGEGRGPPDDPGGGRGPPDEEDDDLLEEVEDDAESLSDDDDDDGDDDDLLEEVEDDDGDDGDDGDDDDDGDDGDDDDDGDDGDD
ncbi:hypothetical protein [Halorarius halobius]|uniref:hypothetical protein n=1 Tax=Halorarius halobius TaxID=2962671 RepID=UPI0020CD9088|nr:hypothetical protein [Halorarius halobius]